MDENGLQLFNKTITKVETKNYLERVLGKKAASFSNNIVALVANDVNLQKCAPFTIMFAGIKATALDLPLDKNLGFAYVIPYENRKKGVTEAQFQIGWRGYVQLAIRSGQFAAINVTDVREGELEDFDLLTGEVKFKRIQERENKPVVGYAAYFRLTNGFSKTLYMTKGEIDAHANKYSQTYASKNDFVRKSSKWATDFDAMAKKTCLKLLLGKFAPLSVEMQQAQTYDQAVIRSENEYSYVDNEQNQSRGSKFAEMASEAVVVDNNEKQMPADVNNLFAAEDGAKND